MVSELAKGDYEDMIAEGLNPTLEDFDRLNCIALRLTDGSETTIANFPRVGWAGDVPFFQPTCIALTWYLQYVERTSFDVPFKDSCWYFALAHARQNVFDNLIIPSEIENAVNSWISRLPVTREEMSRACRYAVVGFDDAVPAKTDRQKAIDDNKTDQEKCEESITNISNSITITSALTGLSKNELEHEIPSRLNTMIDSIKKLHCDNVTDQKSKLISDYQLTIREIRKRLIEESTK